MDSQVRLECNFLVFISSTTEDLSFKSISFQTHDKSPGLFGEERWLLVQVCQTESDVGWVCSKLMRQEQHKCHLIYNL